MAAENEKVKNKTARLRWELQDLKVGFAAQNENLEADYQKQVDEMFFYGYRCYMKKHGIANDTLSFLYDDENDESLSSPAQGDRLVLGDEHASWNGFSAEDDFYGEQTWLLFHFLTLVGCGLDFHTCIYNAYTFEFFFFNMIALINFSSNVLSLLICSYYTISISNFY